MRRSNAGDRSNPAPSRVTREYALAQTGLVIGFLIAWESIVRLGFVDAFFISSPTAVTSRFARWVNEGGFVVDAWASLQVILAGWLVAAFVGTIVGFVLASSKWLNDIASPFVDALLATPRVALAPLMILWFGIGFGSKFALILVENIVIAMIVATSAARGADRDLVTLARSLGATRLGVARRIVLPWSFPGLFGGLRLGLAYAFAGGILAELLASSQGLGNFMARSAGRLDTAGVVAALVAVVVIAFGSNALLHRLEVWVLRGWGEPDASSGVRG